MFLDTLKIENFRSFTSQTIPFCDELTVFVGENNGGKSNAIDAIRLVTAPLGGRRDIYCEPTDVRFDSASKKFEIEAHYSGLSGGQPGRFAGAAASESLDTAVFHLMYDDGSGRFPNRPIISAGTRRMPPEKGSHDKIRHVYLPPLRDAKRALASGNPTRIYALMRHFLGDDSPEQIAAQLKRRTDIQLLKKIDGAIDTGLNVLTAGVRRQAASLGFSEDEKLIDIARDLRFRMSDHGIKPEDLRYSGHGYANLLYMATIAIELEKVNEADLTLFLVEEPEAHLHPQLQAAVLAFLDDEAKKSRAKKREKEDFAGEVQVVVATHSPNLSAWVKAENLVVFKSRSAPTTGSQEAETDSTPTTVQEVVIAVAEDAGAKPKPQLSADNDEPDKEAQPSEPTAQPPFRRESCCIPIRRLGLKDTHLKKVNRYVDVTRAAFLFGGRVMLVEGIAEALLLPVFANKLLVDQPEQLRHFKSSVFVAIDGVDFEPYVNLLLTPHNGARISDRLVALTDGDGYHLAEGEKSPGQARIDSYGIIAKAFEAEAVFAGFASNWSIEAELYRTGNQVLLKRTYLEMHRRSEDKWNAAVSNTGDALGEELKKLFKDVRKGEFAQQFADFVAENVEGEELKIPEYIKLGISALVQ